MQIQNLDAAPIFGTSNTDPNFLSLSVDLTSATWNTQTAHEIFTVTGIVRVKILAACSETLTDAGNAGELILGWANDTNGMIATTDSDDLVTGELWYDATPTTVGEGASTALMDYIIYDDDIGYTIGGEALTDGTLNFYCWWQPISAGAAVALGAGGAL